MPSRSRAFQRVSPESMEVDLSEGACDKSPLAAVAAIKLICVIDANS